MKRTWIVLAIVALVAVLGWAWQSRTGPGERRIALSELRDKIEGGWAGQMIGVAYAEPTEFRYRNQIMPEDQLPEWSPERIRRTLGQDDLYVEMTFAQVLDEKGLDATTEDFGAMFREARYPLWHANLAARRALKRGVPATLSGTPRYNAHANDIDFQIESDFIGLMAPGLPQSSNDLAWRVGRVMNYGDGIYGGMFVACMYSAAFFESDPRRIVEAGLACLPTKSPYARVIRDVLDWSRQNPDDWIRVWNRVEEKWNGREPCPDGALVPFNIDAKINGAYIAIGLLYGGGDFEKTIRITTRCGQDSDCNPSSAAGILGVVLGYSRIPEKWKSGIPTIADKNFNYTNYSFRTIVDSTQRRAIELARRNGGRLEDEVLYVRVQNPSPARLEVWDDYGSPVERIDVTDPRWSWKGDWIYGDTRSRGANTRKTNRNTSGVKGAEASIAFEGTGAIVSGPYLPYGGTADVYLDGQLHRTVDVFSDEKYDKGGEAVWHAFGLKPGKHTLRIVVRGEPYPGSQGADVAIEDLIVFRLAPR